MQFSEKRVLIAGGTSGLGLHLAEQFVVQGARVVICGRDSEKGRKAARQSGADFLAINLCEQQQVDNLFDHLHRHHGQLDIAVNCVGFARAASLLEETEQSWQENIDTNLTAIWRCMKWEIRFMLEQISGGSIINMSSIAGLSAYAPDISSYVATKHALVGLTKAAALEYAQHNIRINALCPSRISSTSSEDNSVPMGRTGTLKDVANAAFFLASEQSSFITGQALPVDGGYSAR